MLLMPLFLSLRTCSMLNMVAEETQPINVKAGKKMLHDKEVVRTGRARKKRYSSIVVDALENALTPNTTTANN